MVSYILCFSSNIVRVVVRRVQILIVALNEWNPNLEEGGKENIYTLSGLHMCMTNDIRRMYRKPTFSNLPASVESSVLIALWIQIYTFYK